ncbi:MAG: hypothetical protein ABI478_04135 [Propionivibrio sp.]
MRTSLLAVLCTLGVAACGSTNTKTIPSSGTLLPNYAVQVGSGIAYTVEQVVVAGVTGALVYPVYDPLAPNWRIEERRFGTDTYTFSLTAKHFRTGGDGEALQVLERRAQALQHENGFAGYRLLGYSEGVESSTPFTQRVARGSVQLLPTPLASVR